MAIADSIKESLEKDTDTDIHDFLGDGESIVVRIAYNDAGEIVVEEWSKVYGTDDTGDNETTPQRTQ